jgi:phage gp29-like protein
MGSGVADLQGEVRDDIQRADACQIAGTLTRDLVYPLIALNKPGVDGLRRCPRWVFDLGEADDLALYADALPKLAQGGARIPVTWVHEKLRIPEAADTEAVFGAPPAAPDTPAATPGAPAPVAALKAQAGVKESLTPGPDAPDTANHMTPALAEAADAQVATWVDDIGAMLNSADSLEQFREQLLAHYSELPSDDLVTVMAAALSAIDLRGRAEALAGR